MRQVSVNAPHVDDRLPLHDALAVIKSLDLQRITRCDEIAVLVPVTGAIPVHTYRTPGSCDQRERFAPCEKLHLHFKLANLDLVHRKTLLRKFRGFAREPVPFADQF